MEWLLILLAIWAYLVLYFLYSIGRHLELSLLEVRRSANATEAYLTRIDSTLSIMRLEHQAGTTTLSP